MITELIIITKEGQHFARVMCQWCPQIVDIPVNLEAVDAWRKGALIQNAMPNLSPDLREMLISGTCPTCWNEMFPP